MDYKKVYKSKSDLPIDVQNQIQLYAIDKEFERVHLIGSYSYRSFNSSDIDLLENIRGSNINDLINLTKKGITEVVNNMHSLKNQLFIEVKAGFDKLYDINIGFCSNNKYIMDPDYYELMLHFHTMKYLTDDEIRKIDLVYRNSIKKQIDYEIIYGIMRKRYIVRWSFADIQKGYKILINANNEPYHFTLEMAISQRSPMNIEGIFISSDQNM
jgi:predicted nucleotidyltransferase